MSANLAQAEAWQMSQGGCGTHERVRSPSCQHPIHLPPTHRLLVSMPRIALVQRAARRAAIALSVFPKTRNSEGGRFPSSSHTCPYCSKTLQSTPARDRHIIMKPYCHERHRHAPTHPAPKRRKRKRKRPDADPRPEGEPPQKQTRTYNGGPPPSRGEPAQPHVNNNAERSKDGGPSEVGDERMCGQPFVESFPISTAGAPISSDMREKPDLHAYLKSCGIFSDPKIFETAELLMMTVPKGKDRTRHLQSPAVSTHVQVMTGILTI